MPTGLIGPQSIPGAKPATGERASHPMAPGPDLAERQRLRGRAGRAGVAYVEDSAVGQGDGDGICHDFSR